MSVSARKKNLRIATFNINGIRARLSNLLTWLERETPDVVCLQELKATDAQFPAVAIEAAGYGALWVGQSAWNGVAILSRDSQPIESRRTLPGSRTDKDSRYLEAAVQGIIVGCLYAPNGNPRTSPKFAGKLAWMERFIAHAASLYDCGHPVVLAGDYNVIPTDFDVYKPESWRRDALMQPEVRDCYERVLQQGWTDCLRHLHPDQRVYTFWDYFREHWQRDAGLRIDHLLINAALKRRLKSAGVDRWVRGEAHASDHAPTWIELAPATAAAVRKPAVRKK
jgi:exodeoxyribonuclease-3